MRHVILAFVLFLSVPGYSQAVNPCDLNRDGTVDTLDVQLAVDMAIGVLPCTANIVGARVCTSVTVQRVVIAAFGGACVVTAPHNVVLNWNASISSNVIGYNAYRATQSGGPYVKLNSTPIMGTNYTDLAVQASQTYYYVATSVDSNNNESVYSNEAHATVPAP